MSSDWQLKGLIFHGKMFGQNVKRNCPRWVSVSPRRTLSALEVCSPQSATFTFTLLLYVSRIRFGPPWLTHTHARAETERDIDRYTDTQTAVCNLLNVYI